MPDKIAIPPGIEFRAFGGYSGDIEQNTRFQYRDKFGKIGYIDCGFTITDTEARPYADKSQLPTEIRAATRFTDDQKATVWSILKKTGFKGDNLAEVLQLEAVLRIGAANVRVKTGKAGPTARSMRPTRIQLLADTQVIMEWKLLRPLRDITPDLPDLGGFLTETARNMETAIILTKPPHSVKGSTPEAYINKLMTFCASEVSRAKKAAADNKALIHRGYTSTGIQDLHQTIRPAAAKEARKPALLKKLREIQNLGFYTVYRGINLYTVLAVSSILKEITAATYRSDNGETGEAIRERLAETGITSNGTQYIKIKPRRMINKLHPAPFTSRYEQTRFHQTIADALIYIASHPVAFRDPDRPDDQMRIRIQAPFSFSFDAGELSSGGKAWIFYGFDDAFLNPYTGKKRNFDIFELAPMQYIMDSQETMSTKKAALEALGVIMAEWRSHINHHTAGAARPGGNVIDAETTAPAPVLPPCEIQQRALNLPNREAPRAKVIRLIHDALERQNLRFEQVAINAKETAYRVTEHPKINKEQNPI